MTDFKYICSCGCRINREDIKVLHWREKGKCKRKIICPIHPKGEVIGRVSVCQKKGCNKEIIFPVKGGGIIQYCPKHLKEHLLEKKRRYARKYRKQAEQKKKNNQNNQTDKTNHINYKAKKFRNSEFQDLNKIDCLYRKECTDKYLGYDCIPCKNCEQYTKGGFEKDISRQGEYGIMDISEITFLENAY